MANDSGSRQSGHRGGAKGQRSQFKLTRQRQEVNSAWRGLGYYRRAKSLLTGAQTVMGNSKFKGEDIEALQILLIELMNKARLPSDPVVLEKEIAGVGRYTAGEIAPTQSSQGETDSSTIGAICSQAYGTRVPLVRYPPTFQKYEVLTTELRSMGMSIVCLLDSLPCTPRRPPRRRSNSSGKSLPAWSMICQWINEKG